MSATTITSSLTDNTNNLANAFEQLSNTFGNCCISNINTNTSTGFPSYSTTWGTALPHTIGTWTDSKITLPPPSNIWIKDGKKEGDKMSDTNLDDYFKALLDQYSKDYDEFNEYNKTTSKENKMNIMNTFGQFGPITDDSVALSIKGMAVKSPTGKYVTYDAEKEEMYDVDIMSIKTKSPIFFRVPVAIDDICIGDIIIHNDSHYCYVINGDGKQFTVIDITTSEQRFILPQKSPFGFNFVTKVISLIQANSASADTPFGNMLPFILMNGDGEFKDILPILLMTGQMDDFTQNPMLMYLLLKDNNSDLMPFLLMNSELFK